MPNPVDLKQLGQSALLTVEARYSKVKGRKLAARPGQAPSDQNLSQIRVLLQSLIDGRLRGALTDRLKELLRQESVEGDSLSLVLQQLSGPVIRPTVLSPSPIRPSQVPPNNYKNFEGIPQLVSQLLLKKGSQILVTEEAKKLAHLLHQLSILGPAQPGEIPENLRAELLSSEWPSRLDQTMRAYAAESAGLDPQSQVFVTTVNRWNAQNGIQSDGKNRGFNYYLFGRAQQAEKKGQFFSNYTLNGEVDAAGKSQPIHVEVRRKREGNPEAVVFLQTGYGETIAQYEDIISQLADDGHVVVAFDHRGSGFSGSPLGLRGYLGRPIEILTDAQIVLNFILSQPKYKDLPLYGFGFSQGALLHTLLAQLNPGVYQSNAGLFLIAPLHRLGGSFHQVTESARSRSKQPLEAFAKIDLTRRDPLGRGNLLKQNSVVPLTPWLDRGVMPAHYFMNDAGVVWDRLIEMSLSLGRLVGQAPHEAFVYYGDDDDVIGVKGSFAGNSTRMLRTVRTFNFARERHHFHHSNPKIRRQIIENASRFFKANTAAVASLKLQKVAR